MEQTDRIVNDKELYTGLKSYNGLIMRQKRKSPKQDHLHEDLDTYTTATNEDNQESL